MNLIKKRFDTDINLCKKNLKKKLKDRNRVRGYCFSYLKYKKAFDSINAKNHKKELIQGNAVYNDKLKKLINNFKNIKNNIITIDLKDKENKRLINFSKLFKDKTVMSYDKIYDNISGVFNKFSRRKKKIGQFNLPTSKINFNDDCIKNKFNSIIKKFSNNFYNALNKSNFIQKMDKENNLETIKKYTDFFNFIHKRNHSARNCYNSKFRNKINNKYQQLDNDNSNNVSDNVLKANVFNNNEISIIDINKNKNIIKYKDNIKNLKFFSNKKLYYKNKLLKNIITESNIFNKDKTLKNIKTYNNLDIKTISSSFRNNLSVRKRNNFSNKQQNNEASINKKYSLNNTNTLSSLKINGKSSNYNSISISINNNKKRKKIIKVKNMPIYTANIGNFVKNYNKIINAIKINKIKRKENHLSTYSDIEKASNIKEEMLMFLLKDKYLNSQFPKKPIFKTNQKKIFLKNFAEKLDILENPFNKEPKLEI